MWRRGPRYVLEFFEPVWRPDGDGSAAPVRGAAKADLIQTMTQAWVSVLERSIRSHPADWHMLQKVFVADLDPDRLRRARGGAG
jgi:KDO2-lipid IV(A) lauroyltransferase